MANHPWTAIGLVFVQSSAELFATHAGHADVRQDGVNTVARQKVHGVVGAFDNGGFIAGATEHQPSKLGIHRVIFNDEYLLHDAFLSII
jgi:hypothetical protein